MAEYKTEQRKQLVEFMTRHGELALSVDEWTNMLRSEGCTLGRATVYRNLLKLSEEGSVISSREKRHTHYQISACRGDHLHLKCKGCGKLIHLSHEHSHALKRSLPKEFSVDNVIYGICAECK